MFLVFSSFLSPSASSCPVYNPSGAAAELGPRPITATGCAEAVGPRQRYDERNLWADEQDVSLLNVDNASSSRRENLGITLSDNIAGIT